jgi:ribosomal protein S18 acetylase RimI-like enzyme
MIRSMPVAYQLTARLSRARSAYPHAASGSPAAASTAARSPRITGRGSLGPESYESKSGGSTTWFADNLGAVNGEVRTITADDWPLFRDVSLRALADSPDAFRRTFAEAQALPEDFWRQQAGSAPIMVVLEDGRGVAMGGVFAPPGSAVAYVWGMWTAPEARGRGYAAGILTDLLSFCRERDLGVRLHVTEGNQAARRLYTAHGFRSTGVWEPLREGSALQVEELQLVK